MIRSIVPNCVLVHYSGSIGRLFHPSMKLLNNAYPQNRPQDSKPGLIVLAHERLTYRQQGWHPTVDAYYSEVPYEDEMAVQVFHGVLALIDTSIQLLHYYNIHKKIRSIHNFNLFFNKYS